MGIMRGLALLIVGAGAVLALACAPQAQPTPVPKAEPAAAKPAASPAAKVATRDDLLKPLIEGAKKEGELVVMGVSSVGLAGARELEKAFNESFGLNIRLKYDVEGQEGAKQAQAMTEHKTGATPTFDVIEGVTEKALEFCNVGTCVPIEQWQALLPPGVPEAITSPNVLEGKAFKFADRTKGIVFNSKLTSAAELPKTTKQLADPKYKGKFYTAPWAASWMFGALIYPKDEWLKVLEQIGDNKVTTLTGSAGMNRMALGEFAFEPMANAYQHFQAESQGHGSGLTFFQDFVPLTSVYHFVTKGARHPNAARLFTMWSTGPEFNRVFEKASWTGNLTLESSAVGQFEAKLIKELGGKTIGWLDNKETLAMLEWYSTAQEGTQYEQAILKALKNA